MRKDLRIILILLSCNIFLFSSCVKEEDRYITYARITLNGKPYEHFDTQKWYLSPMFPVISEYNECNRQLYELGLFLRQRDYKGNAYLLHIYFDAPLQRLKINESYTIVPTADTLVYKEKRMEFIMKTWKERRQLSAFGSGGVSILSTINKDGSSDEITSLSGTCVLYGIDSKGFVHGHLKLTGFSSTAQRFNLEGNFTADAGQNNVGQK